MADPRLNIRIGGDDSELRKLLQSIPRQLAELKAAIAKPAKDNGITRALSEAQSQVTALRRQFEELQRGMRQQASNSAALEAQRAITAEVKRRADLEAAAAARNVAAARQLAAENARIAAKRADAMAAFSSATPAQLRTPQDRTSAIGREQTLRRDAELRMLEINRRADAVEAQLNARRAALAKTTQQVGSAAHTAGGKVAGLMNSFRTLLATVGASVSIVALANMSDEAQDLNARLRLATKTTEEFNKAQAGTFKIAQQTRTSLKATGELYARIERSTRQLGVNQATVLQLTKTINQAAQISGAGASAEAALFQLSQGLASGELRGEELNSVLEQTPRLAQAVADGMRIPIGALRDYAKEGKLSAQEVLRALLNQSAVLEAEFAKMPTTIRGGFTLVRNALLNFIQTSDTAAAVAAGLGRALKFIADNMPAVLAALAAVATALAITFSPVIIARFSTALKGLWATMLANPFVAVAAAIAAVTVALYAMRDEIKLGVDDTTSLGDLMRAAWESIAAGISDARRLAGQFFGETRKDAKGAFSDVTTAVSSSVRGQESLWLRALRTVVQVFDMIGATVRGVMHGIGNVVGSGIDALMNNFRQLGAAATAAFSFDFKGVVEASKANLSGWKEAGANIGKNFSDGFREEMLAQEAGGLEASLDGWIKRAEKIGKERAAAEAAAAAGGVGIGAGGGKGGKASAFRADLELLRDQINRSIAELDRLYEEGEIGLREYFKRKAELQTAAIDAGIAQARQELAVAKSQEEQSKALVEITKLQRDRAEVGPRVAREQAAAERELANSLALVKAQIADLSGATGAEAAEQLRQELAAKLRQFGSDPEAQALFTRLFDLRTVRANLDALREKIQQTVSDLRGTEELVAAQDDAGQLTPTAAEEQLQAVRERSIEQLQRYRQALVDLAASSNGDPEVLRQLQAVDTEIARVTANMDQLGQKMKDQAVQSLATFFTDLATGAKSFGEAFRDLVRGFVQGIAQMIAQELALKAVKGILGAFGGSVAVQHSGGLAGQGNSRRLSPMSMALFAGAPRFHTGGLPGLRADEVPAILQKGEEVLSKGDERNVLNGGGRTSAGSGTRVINVIDPALVQDYLDSPAGEDTILNVIGRNPGRVKQVLG